MSGASRSLAPAAELSLADLLNRVLDRGVVVAGEAVVSVGGVDLIRLGLHLVLSSVEAPAAASAPLEAADPGRSGEGDRGGP